MQGVGQLDQQPFAENLDDAGLIGSGFAFVEQIAVILGAPQGNAFLFGGVGFGLGAGALRSDAFQIFHSIGLFPIFLERY